MGDAADGIINGDFDQYTGEYLGNGGGFPRHKLSKDKAQMRAQMLADNIKRVKGILEKSGIDIEKEQAIQFGYQFKTKSKAIIAVYYSSTVVQGKEDETVKKLFQ